MEIPQSWCDALAAIQQVRPDAVLAGGCLRDLDNGRPVKDLDIFVRGCGVDELESLADKLGGAGLDCAEVDTDSLYPVGDLTDLTGFFEVRFAGIAQPVQMIMVEWDTAHIVDRFDYGICRIAFDGRELTRAPEYEDDKEKKVFRLRRRREGPELESSVHRYARLVQKYEGWRFGAFVDHVDEFLDL